MADKQVPLMQKPGYVFRERKRVLARRVQIGDIIQEGPKRSIAASRRSSYTVTDVEVFTHMTYVSVESGHRFCLGLNTDRVYVDREA